MGAQILMGLVLILAAAWLTWDATDVYRAGRR